MALRLVRQTSDTPNITNKDDSIMTRYAYGGYNGVVANYGNECNYSSLLGVFTILEGRIIVDGWEIDIYGNGNKIDFSTVSGVQYHAIYAEINIATENVIIDSTYLSNNYPTIDKGDDLTQIPNGTARLHLYNVQVQNGVITEVLAKFSKIINLREVVDNLISGKTVVGNASNINSLSLKQDENGVLKVGDIIIPQKKLLWSGNETLVYDKDISFAMNDGKTAVDRTLEILYRRGGYKEYTHKFSLLSDSSTDTVIEFEFFGAYSYDGYLNIRSIVSNSTMTQPTILAIYEIIE